jgi:hypothetical protein
MNLSIDDGGCVLLVDAGENDGNADGTRADVPADVR